MIKQLMFLTDFYIFHESGVNITQKVITFFLTIFSIAYKNILKSIINVYSKNIH